MTVDGVYEAPGGEKSLGERSGWTFPYANEEMMKFKHDELFSSDALLLGRVTYEGFAAAWPTMQGAGDFGERMNGLPKYVVSKTLGTAGATDGAGAASNALAWNNSRVISGNLVEEIAKLKNEPGQDILVYGSGTLFRSLLENDLVDEYRLMVFPVILGVGKKLFGDLPHKKELKFKEVKPFESGIVVVTYTK